MAKKKYKSNFTLHLNDEVVNIFDSRLEMLSEFKKEDVTRSSRVEELMRKDNEERPEDKK